MRTPILALPLALLLSCAMPVKRTTAAPPPPAETQVPMLASDSVRTKSFLDSFPDAVSYPATKLGPVLSGPSAGPLCDAIESTWGDPRSFVARVFPSQPHRFLDSILPGVGFVRARISGPGDVDGGERFAVNEGVPKRLGELNKVLLEAGFTFDSTEMPTIAKIAVLFATFGKTIDSSDRIRDGKWPPGAGLRSGAAPDPSVRPPPDTAPGAGFPAVTFLSVKKGEWQHPKHKDIRRGVLVECLVDGKRQSLFVGFSGVQRPEPDAVNSSDGSRLFLFGVIPGPALPPLQKQQSGAGN